MLTANQMRILPDFFNDIPDPLHCVVTNRLCGMATPRDLRLELHPNSDGQMRNLLLTTSQAAINFHTTHTSKTP